MKKDHGEEDYVLILSGLINMRNLLRNQTYECLLNY